MTITVEELAMAECTFCGRPTLATNQGTLGSGGTFYMCMKCQYKCFGAEARGF